MHTKEKLSEVSTEVHLTLVIKVKVKVNVDLYSASS